MFVNLSLDYCFVPDILSTANVPISLLPHTQIPNDAGYLLTSRRLVRGSGFSHGTPSALLIIGLMSHCQVCLKEYVAASSFVCVFLHVAAPSHQQNLIQKHIEIQGLQKSTTLFYQCISADCRKSTNVFLLVCVSHYNDASACFNFVDRPHVICAHPLHTLTDLSFSSTAGATTPRKRKSPSYIYNPLINNKVNCCLQYCCV